MDKELKQQVIKLFKPPFKPSYWLGGIEDATKQPIIHLTGEDAPRGFEDNPGGISNTQLETLSELLAELLNKHWGTEDEWISVETPPLESNNYQIVYNKEKERFVYLAYFDKRNGWLNTMPDCISHWKPLSKLPTI